MDTFQLKTPLLTTDNILDEMQFSNKGFEQDSDFSSGYESADVSDIELEAIPESQTRTKNVQQTAMKFKSTENMSEDLKFIIDMPEMCDVTFLVGPNGVPVHGTRALLATRSKVFYQLILKHLHIRQTLQQKTGKKGKRVGKKEKGVAPSNSPTDRLTIPVRKYDAEVFRMLLQFAHCGVATITDSTVCGLLCGAVQFQLEDLESACWNYIHRYMSAARIGETLLESAISCSTHHIVAREIMNKIYSHLDRRHFSETSLNALETSV